MDTYLTMLYISLEQELALKAFFKSKGWSYTKADLSMVTDKVGPLCPAKTPGPDTSAPSPRSQRKAARAASSAQTQSKTPSKRGTASNAVSPTKVPITSHNEAEAEQGVDDLDFDIIENEDYDEDGDDDFADDLMDEEDNAEISGEKELTTKTTAMTRSGRKSKPTEKAAAAAMASKSSRGSLKSPTKKLIPKIVLKRERAETDATESTSTKRARNDDGTEKGDENIGEEAEDTSLETICTAKEVLDESLDHTNGTIAEAVSENVVKEEPGDAKNEVITAVMKPEPVAEDNEVMTDIVTPEPDAKDYEEMTDMVRSKQTSEEIEGMSEMAGGDCEGIDIGDGDQELITASTSSAGSYELTDFVRLATQRPPGLMDGKFSDVPYTKIMPKGPGRHVSEFYLNMLQMGYKVHVVHMKNDMRALIKRTFSLPGDVFLRRGWLQEFEDWPAMKELLVNKPTDQLARGNFLASLEKVLLEHQIIDKPERLLIFDEKYSKLCGETHPSPKVPHQNTYTVIGGGDAAGNAMSFVVVAEKKLRQKLDECWPGLELSARKKTKQPEVIYSSFLRSKLSPWLQKLDGDEKIVVLYSPEKTKLRYKFVQKWHSMGVVLFPLPIGHSGLFSSFAVPRDGMKMHEAPIQELFEEATSREALKQYFAENGIFPLNK